MEPETAAILVRKDTQLAFMMIKPRKRECQQGLTEQGTVTNPKKKKDEKPQDQADGPSGEAMALRVAQKVGGTHTSTIIPVWVSCTSVPSREVLVYALLDTQSDTTFILKETAKALNARSEPVQLKLSTLASINTYLVGS